jgi:hypothetical protein
VIAKPEQVSLSAWSMEFSRALESARQLQSSADTRELGQQLELDLTAYDEALRKYVKVSERLRHKERALAATVDSLDGSSQKQSQVIHTISSALKAARDTKAAITRNLR